MKNTINLSKQVGWGSSVYEAPHDALSACMYFGNSTQIEFLVKKEHKSQLITFLRSLASRIENFEEFEDIEEF